MLTDPAERSLAESSLRELQKLDELIGIDDKRYLLIRAETLLGELLGLECTGEEDGWNADGTVAFYKHNGDTCPIHEWLVEEDGREIEREAERRDTRRGLFDMRRDLGRAPTAQEWRDERRNL